MHTAILPLACYLLGAIPFSYLTVKWLTGEDLRRHFSGNAGATNAGRVMAQFGPPWVREKASVLAKLVLLLDIAKGAGAVALGQHVGLENGQESLGVVAAVAALLGHAFSPFLKFKGGKGVATSIGAIACLSPLTAAATFGVWLVVWGLTRYISLGSVVAALAVPFLYMGLAHQGYESSRNNYVLGFFVVVAAFVTWKHKSNIGRLLSGTEPKSGKASS
ncbi:MAG: glycerol-3-phosphate 1-O-acyltransferase PlsY [Planctomycetota bacterium]